MGRFLQGYICDVRYLLILILFIRCSDSDDPKDPKSQDSESGYVKGTIVDARGQPLPGVSVIIDNTIFTNTYVNTVTDEKGEYRINVPHVGVWLAYAQYSVRYEDQHYSIYLRPNTAEGFVGDDVATRNFTWALTGKKPLPLTGYFGGSIEIVKGVGSTIYDTENIFFTLTPSAPLIDGSQGAVITKQLDSNNKIEDIPIGKYRITANYHSDAGIVPLALSDFFTQGEFIRELELAFSAHTDLCDNCMIIQYKE